MKSDTQAVVFNGVPLLVLAALYALVGGGIARTFWRQRAGAVLLDWAYALIFPCIGAAAAILGIQVLVDRESVGPSPWPALGALLIASVPPLVVLLRWGERSSAVPTVGRVQAAEDRASLRERELEAIEAIAGSLAVAADAESIARVVLDEIAELFDVEFAGLVLVDEERREARGLVGRLNGADLAFWQGLRFDLGREPSGVASAVFDAAPVIVYDLSTSPSINQRVVEEIGAKSAAFVPLMSGERVIGVLSVATTSAPRAFAADELGPLRTLAAEATLALERAQSATALSEALERERLVASIGHRMRSELNLDSLLDVAVDEVGRALGLERAFVRLGEGGGPATVAAQWHADGVQSLEPQRLPAADLSLSRRETVVVDDVATAVELDNVAGGRDGLLEMGARAVLATPIVLYEETIGTLSLQRAEPLPWSTSDVALAEAVARELGLAIHIARLLRENDLRLSQQTALLHAAQVVTGELRLETVLDLLVDEVTTLVGADAADCYLYTDDQRRLRCAAVHGLDAGLVGFEFPPERGLAARALAQGTPAIVNDYDTLEQPVPHTAYAEFTSAVAAPMTWMGDTQGVLGVGSTKAGHRFTPADGDLLAAFANLAALAIRNAQMFEQRERQARIERAFSRIASLLGESVSVPQTLDAVAHAASESLGGDATAVFMPEGDSFVLAGAHELSSEAEESFRQGLPDAALVLEGVARDRRTIASSTIAGDDRFPGELGWASLIAMPILNPRAAQAGFAVVFFDRTRAFTDDDLALADQLASAAQGALERSELFEAERRSRTLAQQLARTGSAFSAELEPGAVLDEVVEQAPALLRADAASFRSLEADQLVLTAAVGEGVESRLGTAVPATARPVGAVVASRLPVAISDVAADRRLRDGEPMLTDGYTAYLGVPLFGAEGDLQGVLSVFSKSPRAWREEEIDALAALAANASVAFASARLYERVALERERSIAILANVADGIVAVDREGTVVLWNAAAERITGVPSEEALGRTPEQVLQRSLSSDTDEPVGDRLVAIRRQDEEVWLSLTEAVMRDPVGAVAGRIFAFRDISAERLVDQMRSDFVSTVSHELRAPLTSIYGFAATLLREDVAFGEAEQHTFLGYIASEAARLTTIVDKLLSVARLDAGDLTIQAASVDVRELVADVVRQAEADAVPMNGHDFVIDVPEGPVSVETDAEKLRQVLANLVENAVKFSPDGGTVTVGAEIHGDAVELRVADEGVGIPTSERDRIFGKFYRADSSARQGQTGGAGLGLFIAQGLVGVLGGTITVDSVEGEGSSFVVRLPGGRAGSLRTGE